MTEQHTEKDTLISEISALHTTPLGLERIRKNLRLTAQEPVAFCREIILNEQSKVVRKGKNYYVTLDNYIVTVNAYSFTIITARINK